MTTLNNHGASKLPRPSPIARAAIKLALGVTHPGDPQGIVAKRFANVTPLQREAIDMLTRSAVAVPSGDVPESTGYSQVVTGLTALTILGQIRGALDVRMNTSIPYLAADEVTGAIIKQMGQAITCVRGNFGRATVAESTAAAIVVASDTLLEQPSAEAGLTARIVRAAVTACDAEFIRLALDGAAAVASGANTPALLLAQVRLACAELIEAGADARYITLAANPATLLDLALATTTLGTRAFPEVTADGGALAGLPILASRGIAAGRIVAIAGEMVLRAPITPRVEASKNATIEMSDAPTGDAAPGETPTALSQQAVSMFHACLTAMKVILNFGVDFASDTRATFIDGIDLAGEITA